MFMLQIHFTFLYNSLPILSSENGHIIIVPDLT